MDMHENYHPLPDSTTYLDTQESADQTFTPDPTQCGQSHDQSFIPVATGVGRWPLDEHLNPETLVNVKHEIQKKLKDGKSSFVLKMSCRILRVINNQYRERIEMRKFKGKTHRIDTSTRKHVALFDGCDFINAFIEIINPVLDQNNIQPFNKLSLHDNQQELDRKFEPIADYLCDELTLALKVMRSLNDMVYLYPRFLVAMKEVVDKESKAVYYFKQDDEGFVPTFLISNSVDSLHPDFKFVCSLIKQPMETVNHMTGVGSLITKSLAKKNPAVREVIGNRRELLDDQFSDLLSVLGLGMNVMFGGRSFGLGDIQQLGTSLLPPNGSGTLLDDGAVGLLDSLCENVAVAHSDTFLTLSPEASTLVKQTSTASIVPMMDSLGSEFGMNVALMELGLVHNSDMNGLFGSALPTVIWNEIAGKFSDNNVVMNILSALLTPVPLYEGLVNQSGLINENFILDNVNFFANPLSLIGWIIYSDEPVRGIARVISAHNNLVFNYHILNTVKDWSSFSGSIAPLDDIDYREELGAASGLIRKFTPGWQLPMETVGMFELTYNGLVARYNELVAAGYVFDNGETEGEGGLVTPKRGRGRPSNKEKGLVNNINKRTARAELLERLRDWYWNNTRYNPLYPIEWVTINHMDRVRVVCDMFPAPEEFSSLTASARHGVFAQVWTELKKHPTMWIDNWDFSPILNEGETHYVDIEKTRRRNEVYMIQKARFEEFRKTGEVPVYVNDKEVEAEKVQQQRVTLQAQKIRIDHLEKRVKNLEEMMGKLLLTVGVNEC